MRLLRKNSACLSPVVYAAISLVLAALGAFGQPPSVVTPSAFAVSPRLTHVPDAEPAQPPTQHPVRPLPDHGRDNSLTDDPVRQKTPEPMIHVRPNAYFAGVGVNGIVAPPDTNIAVGPNHIVETVNARYAVYNKTGALLAGPKTLSSIWGALGGPCATNNAGDPTVQYDRAADRWLITQLGR